LMPYSHGPEPSHQQVEEERRLFHVAMTRAMKELYLLHARSRLLHGKSLPGEPSPLLQDITQGLCKKDSLRKPKNTHRTEDTQLSMF
jgi:DNA helicase-2/ATP-dependent DNA helicase PcrA